MVDRRKLKANVGLADMGKRSKQHHRTSMAEQIMQERERQARKIPSDEDFERAGAAMDCIIRIARELRDATVHALPETIPLLLLHHHASLIY